MRTIAMAVLLVFGLASSAEAGRRGGSHSSPGRRSSSGHASASHAPRSHAGETGTGSSPHSHAVRGYTTKSGTYVAPHRATDPDHTQRNNYTTKGNVNPSNGKTGTKYATH